MEQMENKETCPVAEAMDMLGKKWIIIILYHLMSGPKRFGQLETDTGVSGRLLSERLKDLERACMVTRTIYPEIPPRVEYTLTDKGREVEPIINEIFRWSTKWQDTCNCEPCAPD